MNFIVVSFIAFVAYLLLAVGTGDFLGLWSSQELIAGVVVALVTGYLANKVFFYKDASSMTKLANPLRWAIWMVYLLGPFAVGLVKANIDVAMRVITGDINPGIVKVDPDLKTDLGAAMLANSITLTPGTLTVDLDEEEKNLYIHWIDVKNSSPSPNEVYGSFGDWVRRIVE